MKHQSALFFMKALVGAQRMAHFFVIFLIYILMIIDHKMLFKIGEKAQHHFSPAPRLPKASTNGHIPEHMCTCEEACIKISIS